MFETEAAPDALSRKRQIVEGWDALAEKWDARAAIVDAWLTPVTTALIEMVHLKPGNRVLELAAGSGGLTLHLARTVGADGRVLATDSSPNMVKLAARNALVAGQKNVTVRVMDGEAPDMNWASMDAVVCRQAFMFFSDPAGTLERLYRVLRPGGGIGLTVFSTPDRNGFMTTPVSILSRWSEPGKISGPVPVGAPTGPGPFSLAEPGMLPSMLQRAGFTDVETRSISSPLHLGSVEEYVRFDRDIFGDIVADLPADVQEKAWREVTQASMGFAAPGSEGAPCELRVVVGRRPAVKSAKE
jgi:ubiquinone/menaquinone biosynthesis C-methylase UbiE